jgi:prevent-host-death family protein
MRRSVRSSTAIRVAEDVVPIAEFKAHLSEVVRGLHGRRRPVVITHNGRPAAVMLSPTEFDRLSERARFVTAVDEGLSDLADGHIVSDAELTEELDKRYGKRRAKRAVR